ncbi:hypothetical protein ACFV16_08490 [Streptomyces massasporeus]|uniref:hypothetical protein n=1 Tax=Streptomyces massasporeus TaxID=67324 RepID=UPI003678B89C
MGDLVQMINAGRLLTQAEPDILPSDTFAVAVARLPAKRRILGADVSSLVESALFGEGVAE